jgi:hypothetical protein
MTDDIVHPYYTQHGAVTSLSTVEPLNLADSQMSRTLNYHSVSSLHFSRIQCVTLPCNRTPEVYFSCHMNLYPLSKISPSPPQVPVLVSIDQGLQAPHM